MRWRIGLIGAARTTGIVLWHVQNARQAFVTAARSEAPRTRDDLEAAPVAPVTEPGGSEDAEFTLLNEQLAQLTTRLHALHPREGGPPGR
jgi:hypothetical protein